MKLYKNVLRVFPLHTLHMLVLFICPDDVIAGIFELGIITEDVFLARTVRMSPKYQLCDRTPFN